MNIKDAAWRETADRVKVLQIAKGSVLFRDGDSCGGYVLVISGAIRVQKMDSQGREIILYRVEDGQSCMLTTICLMGSQHYPAEGIAETDVELAMLSVDDFEQALASSIGFRRFVMDSIGQRICDLMQLVEDVAFGRMDARLARLLLKRARQHSEANKNELGCTHQELAFELGTAREVISRLLKDFERRGWVRLSRGKIQLCELQSLRKITEQDK